MSIRRPDTQYLSTRPFNDAFYSYHETLGIQPVLGANAPQCPAGRILKENGKKLYPGINPGVKTVLTGVIDSVTPLSGFIDSNSAVFTIYSIKTGASQPVGLDFTPRGLPLETGVPHKGQSVYTLGDVVAGGQFYPISPVALGNTPVINADFSTSTYYTFEMSQNTRLNATIVPPNQGTMIYVSFTGNGTATLTFGSNFEANIPPITPAAGKKVTVEFISDGITLCSLSQTRSGQAPPPVYQIVTF
jgi:hypothetical protein